MLLTLDAGNSNITLGVYAETELRAHWRLRTERAGTADEYGVLFRGLFAAAGHDPAALVGIVVASVVSPLDATLARACREYLGLEPVFVGTDIQPDVPNRYRPASDVGADRLVDVLAAIRRHGVPVIVIDCGTATTFDVVSREGEYLGGAIAPGIGISVEALFQAAPRLPRVEWRKPPSVVGQSTVESLQSGVVWGFVSQIEGMVRRLQEVVGEDARVVATGGLAAIIAGATDVIDVVDPFLTLEGLHLAWHEQSCRG
jgi:type III pantothenate kinase